MTKEENGGSDEFRVNREAGDLAMEDEDFGFASRADNALKKVLTVSNERTDGEKGAVRNDGPKVGFSLAYGIKSFGGTCHSERYIITV